MLPKNYSRFCKENGIPPQRKPSFYLIIHEVGKRKPNAEGSEEISYGALTERIDKLEDLIERDLAGVDQKKAGRILAATQLFLEHAKQLKLMGYDVVEEDKMKRMRKNLRMMIRYIENPENWMFLNALSKEDLSSEERERYFKQRQEQIQADKRELRLLRDRWLIADRMAGVAFEGAPYGYP